MLGGSCERRLNLRTAQIMIPTAARCLPICSTSALLFKSTEISGRRQPLAKCYSKVTTASLIYYPRYRTRGRKGK